MGDRVSYVIEQGEGPFRRYYSRKAGLDFGAAGNGWMPSPNDATVFETVAEAAHLLETLLYFQAPDCRISPHAPKRVSSIMGDTHGESEAHRILGVSANATAEEIKDAWRKLAMEHHPDRGGNEERFKAAKAAYERLCR